LKRCFLYSFHAVFRYYDSGAAELDIPNGNLVLENGTSIKMCRSGNTGGNVINQVATRR